MTDRAGLPNVHSVHVHSRPHHIGGPTTMANKKMVIAVFLEIDIRIVVIALIPF